MWRTRAKRTIYLFLGTFLWLLALGGLARSVHTVQARALRPTQELKLRVPPGSRLAVGDLVFLMNERGLERAGEVARSAGKDGLVTLAIEPAPFRRLNASTRATYWQTPLGVEDAVNALLPPAIQRNVAAEILEGWQQYDEQLATAWGPIVSGLVAAYLEAVGDDIEASFRRREDELWSIAKHHSRRFVAEWPTMQERLRPILRAHLTPVLARLMNEAISEAPKVSIAWNVVRGRNAETFRLMLDWLTDYLADMPEEDKAEMTEALRATWEAARQDAALVERLTAIGRGILHDLELRHVLTEIYREAVADNPQTAEFLQKHVVQSEDLRARMYELIELFAPTAQSVAALCLFDETGATRPQIVHLVRSIALRRRVAWVALNTPDLHAPALEAGTTLPGRVGGTAP